MFDFHRLKARICEYYFKKFRLYNSIDSTKFFIQRWLDVLHSYTKLNNFVGFNPTLPVLLHIAPQARAVLIVPTFDKLPNYKVPHFVTIFPVYPYRIVLQHTNIYCDQGLEFLILYLELTGIKLVGLYKIFQEEKYTHELQKKFPDIDIYGTHSYSSFIRQVKLSGVHGSKFQRPSLNCLDKISK